MSTLRFWHPVLDNYEWDLEEYRRRIQPNLPYTRSTTTHDRYFIPARAIKEAEFLFETKRRFPLLKSLEREQNTILQSFPTTLDAILQSLPGVTRFETQTQTVHSTVILGYAECRHDSYLARHYPELQLECSGRLHPELQLEFTGETEREASHFDNHLFGIVQLLGLRHPQVKSMRIGGGISQLYGTKNALFEYAEQSATYNSDALQHIQHLSLNLITFADLKLFLEDSVDPSVFPPFERYTDFSTDFSRVLHCVLRSSLALQTLYIGIGAFDPSFRGEYLGWTTRNFDWRSLVFPNLHSLTFEDAAVDPDDLSEFIRAHAASLRYVGLKFVQIEADPRGGWRQLLFAINCIHNLETVGVHSAMKSLWDAECPRVWCPKMPGDDRSGLVAGTEFPPTLRSFLLGRAEWTEQLEEWLREDHQNLGASVPCRGDIGVGHGVR